ncbi:TPA: hypothetical protein QHC26_005136 [Enterobacter kobei]|uniref:hypothetical protein n=1 Tax=Enterobacter kobei TaxID=208224 RepID=UPI0027FDBCFC|nr:hypothetical protein [Enterobacter kobei]ELN2579111.1 hypothetical protein [Enterobacter kobei]HDT5935228.1 hypothetical protein [Enterobacter kobei]
MKLVDIEKWAPHVGMFMLEFGAVESFTRSLLAEMTPATIYKHIKELPLNKKINIIKDILKHSEEHPDLHQELIQAYKHIDELTEIRNIIAHNTVKLVFWENTEPGDSPCDEALYSEKNSKTITLEEIQNYNANLSALVETLYRIEGTKRGRKIAEDLEYFKISGLSFSGLTNSGEE